MKTYYHPLTDPEAGPVGPLKDRAVVSSIRVEETPGHDRVHVWNRGGKSGVLVVNRGDGEFVAALLLPLISRRGNQDGTGRNQVDHLRDDMNVVLEGWRDEHFKPGPTEALVSEAQLERIVALGRVYHLCKALLDCCAPNTVPA